jgi:FkbM family methyltransferase
MGLRLQVRQLLRMCGHALVRTVHERLDVLERRDNELRLQIASIAESQSALLQASIHLVETLQEAQNEFRLERAAAGQPEGLLDSLRTQITALTESQRSCETALRALRHDLNLQVRREVPQQVCEETDDFAFRNPEVGLMAFLYSSLPTRRAIDVGAHVGEVSERLLRAGYEVYAFEPNPAAYGKLVHRLGSCAAFHPFNFAIGSSEAEMPLHTARDLSGCNRYGDETSFSSLVPHSMPDDLPFTGVTPVAVRSLSGLHQSQVVPADVGLVKIDTEGFDLEVVRGMGDYRYPVVVAEFWDREIPFARAGVAYTLENLVEEMRRRDYPYHIVLYRVWGVDQSAYYSNRSLSVPNAYGNAFFFREYAVFAEAQAWCSAVLPRTYFKPVGSS